ncbi:MAG: hypothetical protein J6T42_04465, partial [Clostridia bacterium]|nr:hypothetical protein [Clostridia bacterium]
NTDRCPCQISGNPLNGLCEKVCVEVNKVFDACMKQSQEDGIVLNLTDNVPASPTYPLTFISAKSTTTEGTLSAVSVDRLADRPNFARVQVTVDVPVEVLYVDANGVEGKAQSTVSFSQDVILFVPEPSVIPYSVKAVVSLISTEGVYTGENQFTVSCCATIILKIIMPVELLVPSYGYCAIPPCQDYSQEVCAGFFELPLFPNTTNI